MRTLYDATSAQILAYYIVVAVLFIYTLYKFRDDTFYGLIIFIFFIGLFVYSGKSIQNFYRIATLLYAVYLMQKTVTMKTLYRDSLIVISFVLFSFTFIYSSILNEDNITLLLSQYSRFLLILIFYFIFIQRISDQSFRQRMNQLLFRLILIQIVLSIVKLITVGPMESIVGSLSYSGGAYASVFPVLGFVFIWMYRGGVISKNDWLIIFGLLLMGFVNYKRAVWFVLPFFIFVFLFYVQKRRIKRYFGVLLILIPAIIYFGIRINPTLNTEGKVWGSFNLNYALDYTFKYSFGDQESQYEENKAIGRGGAMKYLINKLFNENLKREDIIGNGLSLMYVEGAKNESIFLEKYNINSIGAASGFFQFYVVFGFIGTLLAFIFVFGLLRKAKKKRIRWALFAIFFWEFFLYTGALLREPALSITYVYLIIFSNYVSLKQVDRIGNMAQNVDFIQGNSRKNVF